MPERGCEARWSPGFSRLKPGLQHFHLNNSLSGVDTVLGGGIIT